MGDYTAPFGTSPPYIQLIVLLVFNTAIFLGSALVERAFSVDILPIVATMTGSGPIEPAPKQQGAPKNTNETAPKPAAGTTSPFEAFARNFTR